MAIKTGAEYIKSLKKLRPTVYINGEKLASKTGNPVIDHPAVIPSINAVALTYDLAHDSRYADMLTKVSHLTGEPISLFNNIPQSCEDLEDKVHVIRMLRQRAAGVCIMRCSNMDPLPAPYSITYEMDQKLGTKYHQRYVEYVKRLQQNDLYSSAGITDPKGNRKLRPSKQTDPDLYMRVIRKTKDGIVVRGAKFHQSGSLCAHEKLVFPTRALTPEDKEYAIGFSVPSDAKGLIHVMNKTEYGEPSGEIGRDILRYSSHTAMSFFDDVYIPWDNVYLFGEYEYVAPLLDRFSDSHRSQYGGCEAGFADLITGISVALAEAHGLEKDSMVNDKIAEMIYHSELMFAAGIACAHLGYGTPSGAYFPNSILGNTCKICIARSPYEVIKLSEEIAGGIVFTLPGEKDLVHPDLAEKMKKYLKGADSVPVEDKIRLLYLLRSLYLGPTGKAALSCAVSKAGPLQGAKMHLRSIVDLEARKRTARLAAGIIKE